MRIVCVILLVCALSFTTLSARKKVVLRAQPVDADSVSGSKAPMVDSVGFESPFLMPIEVNIDSVSEAFDSHEASDGPSSVLEAEVSSISEDMSILGRSSVDVERMYRFVCSRNPNFERSIAEAFYDLGELYGIRGDVALCQSLIETGWFKFTGGTAVTPDQHNYCGLGVTKLGMKGHSFDTVEDGVRAQLQHLYAYACKKPLPRGEKIIDPRFNLVKRGVASTWKNLNGRWAANSKYAESIMRVYRMMLEYK